MGIGLRVIDARQGAPREVAITPLIIFQNYRGRSIYQGRFNTMDRIRNFLRTSRYVSQGNKLLTRTHIPVWEKGRATIWAPVKVAGVSGTVPKNYYFKKFEAEARKSIAKGFHNFRFVKTVELQRSDRGFYMDFYPWLSNDGTLLSTRRATRLQLVRCMNTFTRNRWSSLYS